MRLKLKPNDWVWTIAYEWDSLEATEDFFIARYCGFGEHPTWHEVAIIFPNPIGNIPVVERELGPFILRTIQR